MADDLGEEPNSDAFMIRLSLREPEGFARIFERHATAIHHYLSKRSGPSAAEDLVSETFIAAFRSRRRYDLTYPDARPWLFGIATNVLRHHRRSEARRARRMISISPEPLEGDLAEQTVSDLVAADAVRGALARLNDRYRDVLTLVAGPGLTYEEVARALDIPIGTVRSRMSRGRKQLRELLAIHGQYEGGDKFNSGVSSPEGHWE